MRKLVVVSLALVLVACTPTPPSGDDAGETGDAGAPDAGARDAGAQDAGAADAGPRDSGPPSDAGPSADAGSADAGQPPDAGPSLDAGAAEDAGPDEDSGPTRLRVVAANLTSGNFQSYDPGHGQRILQGLAPDVALIQEMSYGDNSNAALRGFVDDTFGPEFDFHREDEQLPNGVVSRHPIIESGVWDDPEVDNRELVWARIDVPGERDLWAVSLHLLTANAGTRDDEAVALRDYVIANVPDEDLLVMGGDLNTDSASEAALTTLSAVVSLAHMPVDQAGLTGTNASRSKPYDWVLPDADLEAFHVPVVIGSQSFPDGLVFDTRVYTPLSDVSPAQEGDSAATAMQHMAVVKDFLLVP